MSDVLVVVDDSIPQQWNVGHAEVGMAARNVFLRDGARGYIHHDVAKWLTKADRELLMADLGVQDSGTLRGFKDAVKRWENSGVSRLDRFPAGFRNTAALALFLQEQGYKVQVMTMNREFADAWRQAKGVVVRDVAHLTPIQGKTDFNRARVLVLGATGRNVTASADGTKTWTGAPPAPPQGPRTAGGARTVKGPKAKVKAPPPGVTVNGKVAPPSGAPVAVRTNAGETGAIAPGVSGNLPRPAPRPADPARTGAPTSPTVEDRLHPGYARGDAKFNAVKLGFQGLNRVVHFINDKIQGPKLEEAWTRAKPGVEKELVEHPEFGALVIAHYSKRQKKAGPEQDSPMEHTATFQRLTVVYGYTQDDAKVRYSKGKAELNERGALQEALTEYWMWIAPKQAVDFSKIETPFPAFGLARFANGMDELVNVRFGMLRGFDDRVKSVEKVSGGRHARFLYLAIPGEIGYFAKGRNTKSVEIALARAGVVPQGYDPTRHYVPVVKLDSWANPFDAVAAAVWPADDYTKELFAKTKPTRLDDDITQISDSASFSKLARWVKPHKMEILRDFSADLPHSTSGDKVTETGFPQRVGQKEPPPPPAPR
jgi:hypothetical protein